MVNPPGPPHPYASQPYGQPSYGQPPYGQPSYGQPYPPSGAQPAAPVWGQQPPLGGPPQCEICGGMPAVHATVRGHQGMVVLMRFLKRSGTFCRPCGTALHRRMTADTLWQGWWGPLSMVITPFTVLANVLGPRGAFRSLAPPSGGRRPPLDPGKRVLLRPAALLVTVPVALVVLAVPLLILIGVLVGDKPVHLSVGDCVRNNAEWPRQDLEAVVCGSSPGLYRVSQELTGPGEHCTADGPEIPYIAYAEYSAKGNTLCLVRVR
ncbi:hypothetical protein ABZ442_00205 [Streptomyces triculaminicus]|uniref:LppU/SCO3897 family protein n=1 Tax=Streptomyces triculaminicus TaxID=2816232 RepID=UPI00340ACACC